MIQSCDKLIQTVKTIIAYVGIRRAAQADDIRLSTVKS